MKILFFKKKEEMYFLAGYLGEIIYRNNLLKYYLGSSQRARGSLIEDMTEIFLLLQPQIQDIVLDKFLREEIENLYGDHGGLEIIQKNNYPRKGKITLVVEDRESFPGAFTLGASFNKFYKENPKVEDIQKYLKSEIYFSNVSLEKFYVNHERLLIYVEFIMNEYYRKMIPAVCID